MPPADGLAETLDGSRRVHAQSSVRPTAAGLATVRRLEQSVAAPAASVPSSA